MLGSTDGDKPMNPKGKAHHCQPGHLWELLNKPSRFATVTVQNKGPAEQEVREGIVHADYDPTTNKARVEAAHRALAENYDKTLDEVMEKLNRPGQIDDQTSVTAQVLVTQLQKKGQYGQAIAILENLSEKLSEAGQLVQSASIWGHLTPDGALRYAEKIAKHNTEKDPKTADIRKKRAKEMNKKAKQVVEEINKVDEKTVDEAFDQAVNNLGKKSAKDKLKEKVLKLKNLVVDEGQVQSVVGQYLKTNKVDLKEIVKQHYFQVNKTLKSLQEALVQKANLTDEEAKILSDSIAKELDARTRQAKTQKLKTLLPEVPPAQRRPLADRIIELSNLGALNEASYRQAVANKLGVSPIDETMAKAIFSKASELQNVKNRNERVVKTAELLALFQQLEPPSVGRKLSTIQTMGQLLNPKTAIRNVLGNSLFTAAETGSDVLATMLDIGVSKITGKRSKVLPQLRAAGSGFSRGSKAGVRDALKGIDTSNQGSKFDLPRGQTFKNPVMRALETTLNLELKAVDRAFYEMAFRESVINQLAAQRKSKDYTGRARITPEVLAVAHQDALYKTFQDESLAAKLFIGLKRALNLKQDFGLGDFILKYPKTPANLLSRAFAYSPTGFVKTLHEVVNPVLKGTGMEGFNQKAFVESLSRAVVGTTGVGVMGYMMGKLGLATGERGEDNEIESVKQLEGLGSYKINASGTIRFALSLNPESAKPQKGDIWVSYDWAQPMAVPFSAAVNIAVSGSKPSGEKAVDALAKVGQGIFKGAETLTQQNLVKGLQDLFSVRDEEGDVNVISGLVNVLSNAPSSFVPTISSQANQLIDNKIRDTYDPDLVKQSVNKVKAKVPVLAQTLPERYNVYGQPKERYQDGSNTLFNVLFNPAFVSRMKQDPVGQEILGIYERSGETKQAPRQIAKSIQVSRSGKSERLKLNAQEIAQYQQFAGQRTRYIFERLVEDPKFQGLSDTGKANVMSEVMSDVHTVSKMMLFRHDPKRLSLSARLMKMNRKGPYMGLLKSKIMKQAMEDRQNHKISRQ